MILHKNKWVIVVIIAVISLTIGYFFYSQNSTSEMNMSIDFGAMTIEEKHHYIEPGQYSEMWIIGYNAYEKREIRYKIFIEESMVYNLIEEGEEYMVSARSFREDEEFDYVYKLEQISNQIEYQMRGKGRIK